MVPLISKSSNGIWKKMLANYKYQFRHKGIFMTESEKLLKFIKDKGYDKKLDQALNEGNKKKAHQIIEDWQNEFKSNNQRW